MAINAYPYRWSLEEFLLVWEGGAFSKRAELLDGEVYDAPIGPWHGRTTGRVIRTLPNGSVEVVAGSLPANQSLPEPDCWVLRGGAQPVDQLSPRMLRWAAEDVLLVVEVSDETKDYDLGRKSVMYAESGFAYYWVVAREGSTRIESRPTPATPTASCIGRVTRSRFRMAPTPPWRCPTCSLRLGDRPAMSLSSHPLPRASHP